MPVNLHIRDVPDAVHAELVRRAGQQGVSLRQYVTEVLAQHCVLPALDDWLDGLGALPASAAQPSGADVVEAARAEDDAEVADAPRRP